MRRETSILSKVSRVEELGYVLEVYSHIRHGYCTCSIEGRMPLRSCIVQAAILGMYVCNRFATYEYFTPRGMKVCGSVWDKNYLG